jgi:putative spermidine/putrescine transport system substrate-binding protein
VERRSLRRVRWGGQTVALMAILLLLAGACSSGGGDTSTGGKKFAGRTLTYVAWGGAYQAAEIKAYFDPWSAETGAKVVQVSPTDYAKIKAQVEAGHVTWDLVDVEPHISVLFCQQGLLEKLDWSRIDKTKFAGFIDEDCGLPNLQYSNVISYNTKAFPDEHPHTWADFWDTSKFPGKRQFYNYASGGALEVALLADGVPADKIYPLDVTRALNKLCEIKDQTIWWATGEEGAQNLASGEAAMGLGWNGRIYEKLEQGLPVAMDHNQYLAAYDDQVIPKGSPNKDMAMDLLEYIASPKAQAALTDYIPYSPVNIDAFPMVNQKVAPYLPTDPPNLAQRALILDSVWYAANLDQVNKQFNDWLTSGC